MSAEAIAIAGVGAALLTVLVPLLVSIRGDVRSCAPKPAPIRHDLHTLAERVSPVLRARWARSPVPEALQHGRHPRSAVSGWRAAGGGRGAMTDGATVLFGAAGAVAAVLAVLVPLIRAQGTALRREIEGHRFDDSSIGAGWRDDPND